jgi:hypothetical protein
MHHFTLNYSCCGILPFIKADDYFTLSTPFAVTKDSTLRNGNTFDALEVVGEGTVNEHVTRDYNLKERKKIMRCKITEWKMVHGDECIMQILMRRLLRYNVLEESSAASLSSSCFFLLVRSGIISLYSY